MSSARCRTNLHDRNGIQNSKLELRHLLGDAAVKLDNLAVGTANVLTLHPRELKGSMTKACGATARMVSLDALFACAGLHIIGIQESRVQQDGTMNLPNYKAFQASSTINGEAGVQI